MSVPAMNPAWRGAGRFETRFRPGLVWLATTALFANPPFATDSNFEIDKFLGKCAHLVVEAERVVANLLRGEDKVALSLLFALKDDLSTGSLDKVIDIKRTTGLNLMRLGS